MFLAVLGALFVALAPQVIGVWTLATHAALGIRGIYVAIVFSESMLAVASWILFRRWRWKEQRV